MPQLISSRTAGSRPPDSPGSWCESLVASGRIFPATVSFRRIVDEPVRKEPTDVDWKKTSERCYSRDDRLARRHSVLRPRLRYECQCAAKSGGAAFLAGTVRECLVHARSNDA